MSLIDPAIKSGYDKIATSNAWPEKKKFWFDFNLGVKNGAEGWKDLADAVERAGGFEEGKRIAQVVTGDVGQSSVHRAHFLDALVKLVPDSVAEFGKRVEQIQEREDGKLVLTFYDGSTAEADAVIGCDGVKSRTRQILLDSDPSVQPTFTGKYAYRGLIPMEKACAAVGEEHARNSQMYLGRHGHILTFPIEQGKTMNVVAFQTKSDGKWEDERWVLPMKKEDMFSDFAGWGDKAQKILSVCGQNHGQENER